MSESKNCAECGAQFVPLSNMQKRAKYCSDHCRASANRKTSKEYYHRVVKPARAIAKPKKTECVVCGVEFTASKFGANSAYCSDECRAVGYKQRNRAWRSGRRTVMIDRPIHESVLAFAKHEDITLMEALNYLLNQGMGTSARFQRFMQSTGDG